MREILEREAKILSHDQRVEYFEKGYIGLPGFLSQDWLDCLNQITSDFIEISSGLSYEIGTGKDKRFDLEPSHRPGAPRIRRLNSPVDHHQEYWDFASKGPFVEIAEDLLGPDVKFHHSKLNFKWGNGGEEVKWHQDIQFWPHTNYEVLTLGVYLDDVDPTMAPMGIIPGSHNGPLFDLYDESDTWTGNIADNDLTLLELDSAEYLSGPAGTVTVHNCRCIHGSAPNLSSRTRPLLLCAYSAAHALPITDLARGGKYSETIVKGKAARWAKFDPRPVLLPPDWSKTRYKSIFEHQQKEN